MKYIQSATNKMKSKTAAERDAITEPSLLERVILSEKDEKIACVMALDLILVGIDTVSLIRLVMLLFLRFIRGTGVRHPT